MASGYGKNKSIKDRFNNAAGATGRLIKKIILTAVFLGAASSPFVYQYGTIKEQDVTVVSVQNNTQWNYETQRLEGGYVLKTDRGSFELAPSQMHLQSQDKVDAVWQDIFAGRTYHIKTYGLRVADWQPNILSARELTAAEVRLRNEAQARAAADVVERSGAAAVPVGTVQQPAQTSTQPQPAAVTPQQPGTLSGSMQDCVVTSTDGAKMVTISAPREWECRQVKVPSAISIRPPGN